MDKIFKDFFLHFHNLCNFVNRDFNAKPVIKVYRLEKKRAKIRFVSENPACVLKQNLSGAEPVFVLMRAVYFFPVSDKIIKEFWVMMEL